MERTEARGPANAGLILARLDRLTVWSMPYLFIGVIGLGFLFTFYDIFDINVSFIQTCATIQPHCTPVNAGNYLGLPVLLNLVGYVIGTLMLSPLSDRFGRRDMLLVTLVITGLGSLATAFVTNMSGFVLARAITGIGIGADLAIVNTYINEVAPRSGRAKYTSLIFIMSALGAFVGIWLGLLLTTPSTPFPLGLPFAGAGPHFTNGWQVMYIVGAVLAVVGVLLRIQLPESPRWLVNHGRLDQAERVVSQMESMAARRTTLADVRTPAPIEPESRAIPYATIFRSPTYLKRTLLLLAMWFVSYVTVYAFASGFTTLLSGLHYPPPEAGLIAAFGTVGFILCAVVAYFWGERLERKRWVPISAILTLIGGLVVALAGQTFWLAVVGSMVVFFGFNLWVPIAYSWSTENYPTRARTTGFALVDGIGHLGGGIGILLIAPLIPYMNVMEAFLLIGLFLVIGAVIAQFGLNTRGRPLEELSP
ncbi:MAG: MFS transporter [Thermaerobacter sp.]|nr:MFS transporter [Thermaerobacter sp.]